jgi:hypothetical protein
VLPECLGEVFEMMNMKAVIKNLKLEMRTEEKIPNEVIGDKNRL